jgi:hypothetical protein
MATDDELDRRLTATTRAAIAQIETTIDPTAEFAAFERRREGDAVIGLRATTVPSPARRWVVAATAASLAVAVGVTAVSMSRGPGTEVSRPQLSDSAPTSPQVQPLPTTSVDSSAASRAAAEPRAVAAGSSTVITPSGSITRTCLDIVTVTRPDDPDVIVGQILDGRWIEINDPSDVTIPACEGETSDNSSTVVVPIDTPLGRLRMCLSEETNPIGCVVLVVVDPADTRTAWRPELPPAPTSLDLADVPVLLPDPWPSSLPLLRSGPDSNQSSGTLLQVYANDQGDWLHLETAPTVDLSVGDASIGPWTVTDQSAGADAIVSLATADVTVTLWSQSLAGDDLTSLARQIRQDPDGTWNLGLLPNGLELVSSGPADGSTARRVVQIDQSRGVVLAVEVITDSVALLSPFGSDAPRTVEVNGTRALYIETEASAGTLGTLIWQHRPRIVVRIGAIDTSLDELISIAESITPASDEEWTSIDDSTTGDGCPAFWC